MFLPLYSVCGVLLARILKQFAISSSSESHFVRTLHNDLSVLAGLNSMAHSFIKSHRPLSHKAVIHEEKCVYVMILL